MSASSSRGEAQLECASPRAWECPESSRPRYSPIEGVGMGQGLDLLRGLVDDIHWLDRSAFLSASFSSAAPRVLHSLVSALVPSETPVDVPRLAPGSSRAARAVCVAFAPEDGSSAHDWARRHRMRLLAPDPGVAALAADKLDVSKLFAAAGVETPDCLLVPADRRRPAERYWPSGCEAVVVQRRENNLIGRGTRLARNAAELQSCLDEWHGRELRLSRYVAGPSLTVTACAAADRTIVSAVSQQLVGVSRLTTVWGSHCGNQLLGQADLPFGLHGRVQEAARRVGDQLRERGYRGVFGLDLVADGDRPLVIEVNPRFQTVVSLVQAAETVAGLLPSLGLHVLACLLPSLPAQAVTAPLPPLSQLVIHADRRMELTVLPEPGCYRLGPDGGLVRAGAGHLADLPPDHGLVWAQNRVGARVADGDELALIQLGEAVTERRVDPVLNQRALAWVNAVTRSILRAAG